MNRSVTLCRLLILFMAGWLWVAHTCVGQTYTHPKTGVQGTYAGDCMANTCGGTYMDDGGVGKYSNNINAIYRTFCPDAPGKCIRLTFTSFDLEPAGIFGCADYLSINNGPTQNSPAVWQGCGNTLPPAVTANNPSGCLTVRFTSDATVNAGGWVATISCLNCAGQGPNSSLNTDCRNAEFVCDNLQVIVANSEGPGLVSDGCLSGCAITENYSNWYMLNITQAGTLGLTIDPTPNNIDYDFALYGPVTGGCSNLGTPLRCSFAATTGNTGMSPSYTDVSEGVTGNGWVSSANVSLGTYFLMVNQWTYSVNSRFQLDFSGTAVIGLPPPSASGNSPIAISSNSPVCGNQPLQFTAPSIPGATYSWSGPGGWSSDQQNPTRNPAVPGVYSFYYTVNNCNSASASLTVLVSSPPVASIIPASAVVCAGQSITLTASGGTNYAWSNSASSAAITVSPAATTTYVVTVTDANGCTAAATRTVTVNTAPPAAITPATAAVCSGSSITLTASGGTSYLWNTSATTAAVTVSPAATTAYTVTVTDASGCTAAATRTVTVNTAPPAAITPATAAVCSGSSITLTASGGTSYLWNTSATTAAVTVSPAATTAYTVTVTDASGCTAAATRTVTVHPTPTAIVTPVVANICNGASVTLTASGGTSYQWSNQANTAIITVNPSASTTYHVTVTDANGCTASSSGTVNVNTMMAVTIIPVNPAICEGESAVLTASGGMNYMWSNFATTASITVTPVATSSYSVTAADASGCTGTTTATIIVHPKPLATITPAIGSICQGNFATLTASGGVSYVWNTTATTASITDYPVATTTYSVTVVDVNSCSASTSQTVTVNPTPPAAIIPSSSELCYGESATLTGSGGISYSWSNAATSSSIIVNPAATTDYTVTVADANFCTATATQTVRVNQIPNATVSPSAVAICEGASTMLTADGGIAYSWSNSSVSPSIIVNPLATTTYAVTVIDVNACSATVTQTVIVNPNPVVMLSPSAAEICEGASVMLIAAGGITYQWDNASTTASITVSPAVTTAYTVTVTDANSCTAAETGMVIVHANPFASVSPASAAVCAGGSVILTASGGTAYLWSNGASTASITVSPQSAFTYSVTVTDANACTAAASATVTVNTQLNAAITMTAGSVCEGAAATLTASGGSAYLWSNNSTSASITVSPPVSTTYWVTVTDGSACSATASATLYVNPSPIASITPSASAICSGAWATLTASGGASFAWSNSQTTQIIVINPAATTGYTVTVTDASGCSATASYTMTVHPAPVASITPAATVICSGSSVVLTAQGGAAYLWDNSSVSPSITASPVTTSSYTVTVTDANACMASASATITVNQNPVVSISPAASSICSGQSLTLTASGAMNYVWSNQMAGTSISLNILTSGAFTVTGTDENGCTDTATAFVDVTPAIVLSAHVKNVTCTGDSSGEIVLTVNGGRAPFSYSWNSGAVTKDLINAPAGNYIVTVTDATGCSEIFTESISEPSAPLMVTAAVTDVSCFEGNDGTAHVTATGGTAPYSYRWNDGNISAGRNNLTAGSYTLTVTDNNSCTETRNISITQPDELIISSHITEPTCLENGNDGSISLAVSGGTPPYRFLWTDGNMSGYISNLGPGTYGVTVTDARACLVWDAYSMTYQFDFRVEASPSVTIVRGESATLSYVISGSRGSYTGRWSPASSLSCEVCPEPKASPEVTTLYEIIVSNDAQCSASDTVTVRVVEEIAIHTPNIFTPNGDGSNDMFEVFFPLGAPNFFLIQIFNRWGERVFESDNSAFRWDGTCRGKPLSPDVYVFQIRFAGIGGRERIQKGSVTIVR